MFDDFNLVKLVKIFGYSDFGVGGLFIGSDL